MPKYDSIDECQHRLAGCYVRYGDEAAYVHKPNYLGSPMTNHVGVTLSVCGKPFDGDNVFVVPLDDPKLVYTEFPLGYINTRFGAVYLTRQANRGRQQGINHRNVQTEQDEGCLDRNFHIQWSQDMSGTDSLSKLLQNKYDSLKDATEKSMSYNQKTGLLRSIPISRRFSIAVDIFGSENLFYKTKAVSRRHHGEKFYLPDKTRHLRESLIELGVPV